MGILFSLSAFFIAIVVHEFSHAFVAYKLGDATARMTGRLTLNPLAHIDPFGTILLPVILIALRSPVLFGWAKPVPINFSNLKNPKKDMIWVGLAGPLSNLLVAFATALLLKAGLGGSSAALPFLQYLILINVVLAVFNLVPIPPLDGSRVLMGLLPNPLAYRLATLEPYGFILIFALLYLGFFEKILWPLVGMILYLFSLV